MDEITIEDFFNKYPIEEPRELTRDDLKTVLDITLDSIKVFRKGDLTLTKQEKMDSYKRYCRSQFEKEKKFKNLTVEGKIELERFFNLYGTNAILEHLE